MLMRLWMAGLLTVCAGAAPKEFSGRGANESVEITASPILNRSVLKELLGSDLDGHYIVLKVTVTPKTDEPLAVSRDDFLLRTDKDGERSQPFVASQIAGAGVLVITEGGRGAVMSEDRGPVWGGAPGTDGRPGRMGGGSPSMGNTASDSGPQATMKKDAKADRNPLLTILEQKILPEEKATDAVSGLLYFPIAMKQKAKDLELIYTSPAGKLSLRFK
jgi:hypothetical protein